jgi:signal peptidase II
MWMVTANLAVLSDAFHRRPLMMRWLWLSLLVILLDQGSKQLIDATMSEGEILVITSFFNLTLAYNPGAAFSFLSDQGGWQRWFLTVLAVIVMAVMLVWLKRLESHERWTAIALGLIIGGAFGNALDRLLIGEVIDFIQLHYKGLAWPAFNVADSAITVGVIIMLLDALVMSRRQKSFN